jgi:hypothetical protein
MRERIVYPLGDTVAVVVPFECGLTVQQIAQKDTPAGVPFIIVDATDIPADRTYRAAWRADFSTPDGYGLTADEWAALHSPAPLPPAPTPPEPMPQPEPAPEPAPEPEPEIDNGEGRDRPYPRLP